MPVFASAHGSLDTLYVANGSFTGGTPNVVALGGAPRIP